MVGGIDVIGWEFFDADFEEERQWTIDDGRWFGSGRWSIVRGLFQQRILQPLPLLFIRQRHSPREFADTAEEGLTFGDGDGAAGVEDVEGVRAFEDVVVRGDDETGGETGVGFGGEEIVHGADAVDVGGFKIIFGVFELFLSADLAIGDTCAVVFVPDGFGVVERDEDAFETVGDLDRDGVERDAAHLLEVGELRDLLPVEPDFPAQAPGGDGGLLPVIFHEADVVLARVDAEGFERLEVEFLRVARVGLEDDLKLGVELEAVGVLAVPPIVGAHRRLDIGDVPRFGSKHAQEGGRVHRPCTDLGVVWLGDETSLGCPEVL